ncbi:MAG TPA: hypothetical protein VL443_05925, partial [Cyclobacteriaceae bacterium]|nr:hypothetical protein [Cyclobacteriaceae bacterium]
AVMVVVTIVGLLMVSTLIGIVNAGITDTLVNMRKGRSFVSEKDHILILGWSPMIFPLLSKLACARQKHERLVIVILADKDKIEMEDEIKSKVPHDTKVRIICRSGNVIDRNDIEIVNPHEARTIVVMAQENDVHDTHSIKTIMALMKSHNRKSEKYHIVIEVRDRENLEVLDLIGKDEITTIVTEELFSKMIVQTSLQSGLSEVYNELLDFNDIETELIDAHELQGLTYEQCLLSFSDGALIGIHNEENIPDTNPPPSLIVKAEDKLIVITRRDRGIRKSKPVVDESVFSHCADNKRPPQKTLLLGWNHKAPEIIRTLDQHFTKGSEITVFAELDDLDEKIEVLKTQLSNQTLKLEKGNIRNKVQLSRLITSENYQHVILLCYSDTLDMQGADALTLITLIQLRMIEKEAGRNFTIVSEMLDNRNRSLAEVTHADDFIISSNLISMVMAQLACNIKLKKIFDEFLTPGGSDIFMRPVTNYISIDKPVNFYTLAASALKKNQTAIGYRIASLANNPEKRYGVMLAPCKEDLIQFASGDKVIVIADLKEMV